MVGDTIVKPLGLKLSYIFQCMSVLHQPWLIPQDLNLVHLHLVAMDTLSISCVMFQHDVVVPTYPYPNLEENNTLNKSSAMVQGVVLEVG